MMDSAKFQKKIEDFVCTHCATEVTGTGYTNHCPRCLWSKHVDIKPGDRAETCGGMMEPTAVEGTTPNYRLVHRCGSCGLVKRNDVTAADSTAAIIALAEKSARQTGH